MLEPGNTIGILGGGQLGRMLAMSAAQLGLRVHIFSPEEHSVAAEVSASYTCAAWDDTAALAAFAATCAAITFEFENIDVAPLAALPQAKVAPSLRALEIAQDRLKEKAFVVAQGGNVAPYAPVSSPADLGAAVAQIGVPGIIKTCRDGYDGKGQWRIMEGGDLTTVALPDAPCVYEGFVHFDCEFSVILVRGHDGEVRFWDSAHNTHENGILAHSTLPPPEIVTDQVPAARRLAQRVAEALGYVGVMTCEFFATQSGPVFNEMAPRVHNSGHWSIEGAVTSQFENHIRAVAGLPLGDTASVAGRIVMDNLIGEEALDIARHLADPAAHLHLYGKGEARPGRKMGHVTRVG